MVCKKPQGAQTELYVQSELSQRLGVEGSVGVVRRSTPSFPFSRVHGPGSRPERNYHPWLRRYSENCDVIEATWYTQNSEERRKSCEVACFTHCTSSFPKGAPARVSLQVEVSTRPCPTHQHSQQVCFQHFLFSTLLPQAF